MSLAEFRGNLVEFQKGGKYFIRISLGRTPFSCSLKNSVCYIDLVFFVFLVFPNSKKLRTKRDLPVFLVLLVFENRK